jgi:hypothetical protein
MKDIEKQIKEDCCIYSSTDDLDGLTHDIKKELDKDKKRIDKTLISAEFGTRFRDSKEENKEDKDVIKDAKK